MKYRKLKTGEIVRKTDEFQSTFSPAGVYSPVAKCTIGQRLLACNVPYYRRPVAGKSK